MSDQASHLRHLVLRAARLRGAEGAPPPRIVAVLAAREGLGVTTAAALLGQALADQGSRVVLIDCDRQQTDLANRCGLVVPASYTAKVARQDIHEALLPLPGGLQIVPGVWEDAAKPAERVLQQLLRQFQQLGRHADLLVLDLGCVETEVLCAWRDSIETFLLVTTPASAAVMDTYTLIKRFLANRAGQGTELLVNQAAQRREADDVFARVDRSCRRFLGFGLELAGHLPSPARASDLNAIAARLSEGNSDGQRRSAA
jgi:MinD-like ATPase involved in chromosome partitioning or flagellar assembly